MRKFILIALLIFLTSCVNLKPFSVGEDVDASWQIKNLHDTAVKFSELSKSMCRYVNNSRLAVLDFVNDNSNYIDSNGKYLAFLLSEDLDKNCQTNARYEGSPSWFDYKHLIIKSTRPNSYDFAIVGDFIYYNHCYFVYVRIVDLKLNIIAKAFQFPVARYNINFSIEPLTIPNYVEFP